MPKIREYWVFAATMTQGVGATTPIGFRINPGPNELKLMNVAISFGAVGTARAIILNHVDKLGGLLQSLMADSIDDNETIFGPTLRTHVSTVTADTPNALGVSEIPVRVIDTDHLIFEAASVASGEVITVRIRGLVANEEQPSINVIGDIKPVELYNEVL